MNHLSLFDLCTWFQTDVDTLRSIYLDASLQFPRMVRIGGVMGWIESDVVAWVAWLDERREYEASGLNADEVPLPRYTQGPRSKRETVPPSEEQE